ncbi:MAG: hypothetical protein ACYCYK_07105 [Candidatus Dormibacteria bacterium]
MKFAEEVMEILEAFDLTQSYRSAALLAACSHNTVAHYVAVREAGGVSAELMCGLSFRRHLRCDYPICQIASNCQSNASPSRIQVSVGVTLPVHPPDPHAPTRARR